MIPSTAAIRASRRRGSSSGDIYGSIKAALTRRGEIIGPNDLLIAAIALANGVTLVTRNVREFARVEKLLIENWEG